MADKQPNKITSRSAAFQPRARLISALGTDLISSETVAVLELVKNAYDADASHVVIELEAPLCQGSGAVVIADDGLGISIDTLERAWLQPANNTKRLHSRSARGRRYLGAKGIGRFAAAKLGSHLSLTSKTPNSELETVAEFDWTQFEDDSAMLSDIKVPYHERSSEDSSTRYLESKGIQTRSPSGTLLRAERLRTDWGEEQVQALRTGLARLLSPLPSDDALGIYLSLPEQFSHLDGWVEPPKTLEHPKYQLDGEVDGQGGYTLHVNWPDGQRSMIGSWNIDDKGVAIDGIGRAPSCGSFLFQLRVWDRDAGSLSTLAADLGSTVTSVRRDLNDMSGVNVYRDGFRVMPYGEPGDDWLRLDSRRIQNPSLRISNNQILGFVMISADDNPLLTDQTNREGLMENAALQDLRALLRAGLSKLELAREAYRRPPKEDAAGSLFHLDGLEDLHNYAEKRKKADPGLNKLVLRVEESYQRQTRATQEVLARYRRLATLGQLIDMVLHEGRHPLSRIRSQSQLALKALGTGAPPQSLGERLKAIEHHGSALDQIFNRIEPFGGRKGGRPRTVHLEELVQDAMGTFHTELRRNSIDVSLPEGTTSVTVDAAEIGQVLVNLIQNAVYWLRGVPADRRKIAVSIQRLPSGHVELLFCDSGPGIDPDDADRVFAPYFSTKPDGVGLGLAIAGEIVADYYDGTLELVRDGLLDGACFRALLRRRV